MTSFEYIITTIEEYCVKHNLNHRFVGGVSFGGLVNENTSADIDNDSKTIKLINHNKETLLRSDKTVRDIDIIFFCEDRTKLTKFAAFIKRLEKEAKNKTQFPDISYEPTIYPSFGKRNPFAQFVTALEVDKKNHLFLTFDDVQQQISWESVEPWKVVLENSVQFTVRNPIADYYAYLFRSPGGPKPKDEKKLKDLKKLADHMMKVGKKHDPVIDYASEIYYGSWQTYIDKLNKTENPVTNTKKFWLRVYWMTIGTLLAHTFTRSHHSFTGMKKS